MVNKPFPNMDKPVNNEKCQSIILNLLEMNETRSIPASSYVRLWQQITRENLKETNKRIKDYKGFLTDKVYDRITNSKAKPEDNIDAIDAVAHYKRDDRRILISNLDLKSWFKYHVFQHSDRTQQIIGIIGLGFLGKGLWKHWIKKN